MAGLLGSVAVALCSISIRGYGKTVVMGVAGGKQPGGDLWSTLKRLAQVKDAAILPHGKIRIVSCLVLLLTYTLS